jgi:ESCRT-I complex subunit VPS28
MAAELRRMQSEAEDEKLWQTGREQEVWENLADLYAIFKTTEALERANMRNSIPDGEYAPNCRRLIESFRNIKLLLESGEAGHTVDSFREEYKIDTECPLGKKRLIDDPNPVSNVPDDAGDAIVVATAVVHHFITVMDNLRMDLVAVDQFQPLLEELYASLNKMSSRLPDRWVGLEKSREWLTKLKGMQASDELSEDEVRQCLFDMDTAYNDFHKQLEGPTRPTV